MAQTGLFRKRNKLTTLGTPIIDGADRARMAVDDKRAPRPLLPSPALGPVRTPTPGERLDIAQSVNAEANRFARELATSVGTKDLRRAMADYLAGLGIMRGPESRCA